MGLLNDWLDSVSDRMEIANEARERVNERRRDFFEDVAEQAHENNQRVLDNLEDHGVNVDFFRDIL
jgi:hypothetical protein